MINGIDEEDLTLTLDNTSNGQSGSWNLAFSGSSTYSLYRFTSDGDVLAEITLDENIVPNLSIIV